MMYLVAVPNKYMHLCKFRGKQLPDCPPLVAGLEQTILFTNLL